MGVAKGVRVGESRAEAPAGRVEMRCAGAGDLRESRRAASVRGRASSTAVTIWRRSSRRERPRIGLHACCEKQPPQRKQQSSRAHQNCVPHSSSPSGRPATTQRHMPHFKESERVREVERVGHQTARAPVRSLVARHKLLLRDRRQRVAGNHPCAFNVARRRERPAAAALALVLHRGHRSLRAPVNRVSSRRWGRPPSTPHVPSPWRSRRPHCGTP